jgi:hypothetical protein
MIVRNQKQNTENTENTEVIETSETNETNENVETSNYNDKYVKHIIVKYNDALKNWGRYYFNIDYFGRLTIQRIAGKFLEESMLYTLLRKIEDTEKISFKEMHLKRVSPYRVRVKTGSSGCKDYWVEYLKDSKTMQICRGGQLHISMAGVLNEDIELPAMDIYPILFSKKIYKRGNSALHLLEYVDRPGNDLFLQKIDENLKIDIVYLDKEWEMKKFSYDDDEDKKEDICL